MTDLAMGWKNIPLVPLLDIYTEELNTGQKELCKTMNNHKTTNKAKI
jgi:hypothetical protein